MKTVSYIFVHIAEWPVTHNDVTKLLCLLHYSLRMLNCFAFATLAYLYVCYAVLFRFSIGTLSSLVFFTFFWQEDEFNIYMIYVECYFLVTLPWPILELKGSVRDVQKGHPAFVSQVDLIPLNRWEFKVLGTMGLNRLPSCTRFLWHTALLTISHFLSEILENLC